MRAHLFALALLLTACEVQSDNATENAAADNAANATGENAVGNATAAPGADGGSATSAGMPVPPEPAEGATLSVTPARAAPGGTMTLTLSNGTSEPVGYNLCTSALETPGGTPVPSDRICTMEIRTLDPGRSATYGYDLPRTLAPGWYRFSTGIQLMRSETQTVSKSNTFQVR